MKYVGVIGASSCDLDLWNIAYRVGKAIALHKAVLVCGGMGGVMEASCKGAIENGGITIGILPTDSREWANKYLTYSIPTGMGEARNIIVVRSSDVVIAIDGSFGTLSEISFALKFGKPVFGISTWKIEDGKGIKGYIKYGSNPEELVDVALKSVF